MWTALNRSSEAQDTWQVGGRRCGVECAGGARFAGRRAQDTVLHVDGEPVVAEEVGSEDRRRDVSDEEPPLVGTAGEDDGVIGVTVRPYGAPVGSSQAGRGGRIQSAVWWKLARRQHAELSSSVPHHGELPIGDVQQRRRRCWARGRR